MGMALEKCDLSTVKAGDKFVLGNADKMTEMELWTQKLGHDGAVEKLMESSPWLLDIPAKDLSVVMDFFEYLDAIQSHTFEDDALIVGEQGCLFLRCLTTLEFFFEHREAVGEKF